MARRERGMAAELMDEVCRAVKGDAENEAGVRSELSMLLPAAAVPARPANAPRAAETGQSQSARSPRCARRMSKCSCDAAASR